MLLCITTDEDTAEAILDCGACWYGFVCGVYFIFGIA